MQPATANMIPLVSADPVELSIVMPCLDEAETLGIGIAKANRFFAKNGVASLVIADNGSTDGSQQIATSLGARVVAVPIRVMARRSRHSRFQRHLFRALA
jgi:glycosyltransferase involved in cell wall biosynthesis